MQLDIVHPKPSKVIAFNFFLLAMDLWVAGILVKDP